MRVTTRNQNRAATARAAISDRRVARELRRSRRHATRAIRLAMQPRRTHRLRNATLVVAGTGIVGGIAYGGWRKKSHTPAES
jgi:hypothetical protein